MNQRRTFDLTKYEKQYLKNPGVYVADLTAYPLSKVPFSFSHGGELVPDSKTEVRQNLIWRLESQTTKPF